MSVYLRKSSSGPGAQDQRSWECSLKLIEKRSFYLLSKSPCSVGLGRIDTNREERVLTGELSQVTYSLRE